MSEKPIEQKVEKPTYNLLTNFDETLRAMAEVEGHEDWFKTSQSSSGTGSVRQALEQLKEWGDPKDQEESNALVDIYGSLGSNRWMVMRNGEVRFSRFHANLEKIQKAEEMGFKIFE